MTKNVLYVGNYLKGPKRNPSYMFTLGPLLEGLNYRLTYTSSQTLRLLRLLDMILTLIRRQGKTDVVLIDTYSTQNFYYAVVIGWLCRRFNLPYIPILHGGKLPSRLKRSPKMSRQLFGKAYCNVAPSGYLEKAFKDKDFPNLQLIPNVLSLDQLPYTNRSSGSYKLLWVRRLQELYNPMMALKVVKVLQNQGADVELCMVGADSGGLMEQLKHYADNHQLKVSFKGQLSKPDWIQLSKSYSLFLNTTNVDNTPLSLMEAMALGLGVVSTNVGGIPYLIEDGKEGLLVPVDDPKAMAKAVIQLVEDEHLFREMTTAARKKVEQFDGEVVKEQWRELLEGAVNSKK